ncbi:MAG: type II toxin-antitoxin system mRNA interferase toxin, RelE/StbE family [Terriglobia bacterium]|jgi:addiction module RelE/StbE family toxin
MQVILEQSFLKSARRLPQSIKEKLGELLGLLETNPYHSLLHTKQLSGELAGFFSFRITRDWRVIFYFEDPETIHVLEAGHRKDIYR